MFILEWISLFTAHCMCKLELDNLLLKKIDLINFIVMEYMQTKRGQRALIFGGRSFRLKEKYKNGNKRWLCRSRQCTGSLITSADEKVIKDQGHSCAPDHAKIAVEKMKSEGLRRCREELTPISMIHKEIFSPALDQGLDLLVKVPHLSSVKSSMYRNRSKALEESYCDDEYDGCITLDSTEETETKTVDSSTTTPAECVQTVLEEKKEPSLEERYFPSPPTVSFEGLDSALPDESVRFDDLTEDMSGASDTEAAGKAGDSSANEDIEFSDDDSAENELVSLGYRVEVKAKFLNKCLIYGKTAKKLTRCLVDVIFSDTKLLANCSAFGNKSHLTKLTRAALPSRKVACIIDYVKKRFPDASKSEIVLAINLKCKEARAIIGKSGSDGKKPVVRRLLAKEQELESSAVSSSHPQKVQSSGLTKIKLSQPAKVQKLTTVSKTGTTTTVTVAAPITVLRQPPNIVCVQKNPSKAPPLLQQKGIRTGLVQLRLPVNTAPTSTLAHRPPPAILGKSTTVLKVPPRTKPETIRSILTRAQPQAGKTGGNKILLPLHFIHQKAGSAPGKPSSETTDAVTGSQRQCIIVGTRTAEATSSTPQTASTNSQNPCISTVKQE